MRILTYNIHGGIGTDRKYSPERILSVISEIDADLVSLQEVYENRSTENFIHLLNGLPNYHVVEGPTLDRPDGSYGNMLLSKFPVIDHRKIDISFPNREPRGAIRAFVKNDTETIEIIATHFGLIPTERMAQLKKILDMPKPNITPDLKIVAGDLNNWNTQSRFARLLKRRFGPMPHKSPRTFPSKFPIFKLDRIIVEPKERLFSLAIPRVKYVKQASDHLPLVAEVKSVPCTVD